MRPVEAVDLEPVAGVEGRVGPADPGQGGRGPVGRDQGIARTDLKETRAGGDQGGDLGDVAVIEQAGDGLAARCGAAGHPLLKAIERAGDHGDLDPRLDGRREHRHPAAVREPDATDPIRVNLRPARQRVDGPEHVAQVLGDQEPPERLEGDERRPAGISASLRPTTAAAERRQAGGRDDVAAADELPPVIIVVRRDRLLPLGRVVAADHGVVAEIAMPMDGDDAGAFPRTPARQEQIHGQRFDPLR